jgi:hypothetical protein
VGSQSRRCSPPDIRGSVAWWRQIGRTLRGRADWIRRVEFSNHCDFVELHVERLHEQGRSADRSERHEHERHVLIYPVRRWPSGGSSDVVQPLSRRDYRAAVVTDQIAKPASAASWWQERRNRAVLIGREHIIGYGALRPWGTQA